ncbi:MAG: hypothetical protein EOO25_08615 [Comamonadaceae bacterium]|nr:MAG: hypothetical protein EOO25_08615 [Comamonadaceae bacterium]
MTKHQTQGGSTPAERVAVIAIHGVADQKPGATAREVASLLINAGHLEARYTEGSCDSLIVPVPLLSPKVSPDRHQAPAGTRPMVNALRQAARSDFQREQWTAAPPLAGDAVPAPVKQLAEADAGIAFSDYLLFKAQRNGGGNEAYEAARIRMTRAPRNGAPAKQVDVHEMYWADLSRLSGALPRIVTEIFTMVFRLSRLGRDTVDQAARAARQRHAGDAAPKADVWRGLVAVQIALDWAFSALLANLFTQLLVIGLLIAATGFAISREDTVRAVLACALPALGAWWLCYRHTESAASRIAVLAGALAAGWLLFRLPAHWVIGLSFLVILGLLCDYGLRVAEERFPAARAAGLVFLAGAAAVLLASLLLNQSSSSGAGDLGDWVVAGMRTVEVLLVMMVAWWAVAAVLLAAWFVLGQRAARESAAARASVATGRLGLFVSIASFVAIVMAIWALVTTLVELGAAGVHYTPLFFPVGDSDGVDGAVFLHDRYQNSTEAFALAAGLTLVLLLYLVVVLAPSILAEVKATAGTPQTLGRWLSGGYRNLDRVITGVVIASVLVACFVGLLLLLARFGSEPGGWIAQTALVIADISRNILKPLVIGAATAAAALSAFGGVISRYLPWLRLPLDVALDVDNHFREFPRKAISRARIFSRYAALLEHIVAQKYDRIVIVAHSQGTVISAELLRYLQFRAQSRAADGDGGAAPSLWAGLQGKVDLLTAGCPLRQLYAARFPDLYEWVARDRGAVCGPSAADIGVNRWINVYTTGDYVGRWLWCDAPPAVDSVGAKKTLHDPAPQLPPGTPAEMDLCLGSGAHTHYFDQAETRVASCIDALVAGRPAAAT